VSHLADMTIVNLGKTPMMIGREAAAHGKPRAAALRRRAVALLLGAIVVCAGILLARQAIMPTAPPTSARNAPTLPLQTAEIASAARSTQVLQPPITLKVRTASIKPPDGIGQPGEFRPPLRLAPPYGIVDSVHLEQNGKKIRLAFVEGLERDAVCKDSNARRFACGLRGRASLAKLTGGQPLTCWPAFEAGDEIPYQCFAAGRDIARDQAAAGFAQPVLPSAAPYPARDATNDEAFVSESPDLPELDPDSPAN